MTILLLTLYILGIFGSFFLIHLFDICDEDNDPVTIWIAVVWPLSIPIFLICGVFVWLADKAKEIRTKMQSGKENE